MSLWHMAWRQLWSRPVVSGLTVLGVTLGTALVCAVLLLHRETERVLIDEGMIYDLVVGAKGSPLQLVLSSIYHLDVPTGNIPYARYETLRNDPRVRDAIPIGLGDNFRGYRIVGTDPAMLSLTDRETGEPIYEVSDGRPFEASFEVVLGAAVKHLQIGDSFVGTHGLIATTGAPAHDAFPYRVVGMLQPTGGAADRAIFTTLDSVWIVHEAEAAQHSGWTEGQNEQGREVTAVLVRLHTIGLRLWMAEEIREQTEAITAIPVNEILRLYQGALAPLQRVFLGLAVIVVAVSALGVGTTLYQSSESRRRDLAVLRSLGAHPREIFVLVALEGIGIVLLGIFAGSVVGHGSVAVAGTWIRESTGLVVNAWSFDMTEAIALTAIAAAGTLAGLVSAAVTYGDDPIRHLGRG